MKAMAILFTLILISSHSSQAQFLSGSGVWGGSQGCSYDMAHGDGATSSSDSILKRRSRALLKLEQKLEKKISKIESNREKIEKYEDRIKDIFVRTTSSGSQVQRYVFSHLRDRNNPVLKQPACAKDSASSSDSREAPRGPNPRPASSLEASLGCTDKPICSDCVTHVDNLYEMCSQPKFLKSGDSSSPERCTAAMDGYRKYAEKEKEIDREIAALESAIELKKDSIEDRQEELADREDTEAGYCADGSCSEFGKNLLLSGLTGVLAYQGLKYVSDTNAELSYATPVNLGLGSASVALGTYGALTSGAGRGAYGCSHTGAGYYNDPMSAYASILGGAALAGGAYYPNAGSGGAFNYPQNYYQNPYGGGMYNQGYLPGGGYPGYNGGLGVNAGVQYGPGGGYPGLYPLGGNGGVYQQGPLGYPGGGGQIGGYPQGPLGYPGANGGQWGYPQNPLGYPGGGGQIGGYPQNPLGYPGGGGQIAGYPNLNGQIGGLNNQACYCVQAPCNCQNYQGGGQLNYPYNAQYQQQSYQLQQQYYQQQMQLQIQIQQQQQAKAIQVQELQAQIFRLNQQIQEISAGSYYNGGSLGGSISLGISGGVGYSTGGTSFNNGGGALAPLNQNGTSQQAPLSRGQ